LAHTAGRAQHDAELLLSKQIHSFCAGINAIPTFFPFLFSDLTRGPLCLCRRERREVMRLNAKLSRDIATAAKDSAAESKRKSSRASKEAFRDVLQQRQAEIDAVQAANASRRALVQEERSKMHVALSSIGCSNFARADAVRMELQESARRLAKEVAMELEQKRDLIRQLRAADKVPAGRMTAFDPTETGRHGLLEEMSILVRSFEVLIAFMTLRTH
jgi:hypothetical protein